MALEKRMHLFKDKDQKKQQENHTIVANEWANFPKAAHFCLTAQYLKFIQP